MQRQIQSVCGDKYRLNAKANAKCMQTQLQSVCKDKYKVRAKINKNYELQANTNTNVDKNE